MDTCWSLAVLVCLLPASGGQPVHTVEICTSFPSSPLNLTCETGEMLHVISVRYQNMTPSCESPPGASCVFLQETQADSLYTDCNGVATCEMEVQKFWVDNVCGETTAYQATISYECVADDPVDVCDNVTHLSRLNDNRLFLASPSYPHSTISGSGTCTCDVTGGDMNVTVLEYQFFPVQGVRANLTLTGDTTTWESFTAGSLAYNRLVMGNTDRLGIVFDPIPTSAKKKELMWFKVEGTSTLQVSCNGSPPPTTITPGTTAKTIEGTGSFSSFSTSNTTVAVASSSPDGAQRQPDDGSNTVAVAVGCVFAVIVVAAIVVIVVFILLRRKRLKPYLSSAEKLHNESGDAGGSKEDEAHEMPRYVTDVPYCTTADQIRRPLSTEYAELDAHRSIKVDNVKVSVTKLDGRDNSSSSNGTPGSIVPYTSKRLEELYAKVIPKKFRSTKNREVEDKSVRDESVRDSALDCDIGSVEQVTKQRPVSKGGRHFSEPDYQEIGDISNSQPVPEANSQQGPPVFLPHPPLSSDQVPPVPEKSEAAFQRLEEEKSDDKKGTKIKKERRKSTDSYVSSNEKKRKKRKERSPKSEKEKSTIQYVEIEIPANPANALTPPSTDISYQDDVIVENPLYEGGPADDELTESPGDQRPLSEHYEDIRSDAHSTQTHVNIDMNPGRPPPYEEVTI